MANVTLYNKKTRASVRFSTHSMSPSLAPTMKTTDSAVTEITTDIEKGLERLENKALSSQRVMLDEERSDNLKKLALGAKLDRALDRRMSSQDAVMRTRTKSTGSTESRISDCEKEQA